MANENFKTLTSSDNLLSAVGWIGVIMLVSIQLQQHPHRSCTTAALPPMLQFEAPFPQNPLHSLVTMPRATHPIKMPVDASENLATCPLWSFFSPPRTGPIKM